MAGLDAEVSRLVVQTLPNGAYAMRVAKNHAAYRRAVTATWAHNAEAARMVLESTNAFYVRRDPALRHGWDPERPYMVAEVCIHDSLVRSEVDARREMLRLSLEQEGVRAEELRIIASKWGMRERHPFVKASSEPAVAKGEDCLPRQELAELETLKRAFCVVFGVNAEMVLDRLNAAYLEEAYWDDAKADWRLDRWFWCHLYSADPAFEALIALRRRALMAEARDLGLRLRGVRYHAWTGAQDARAFPACGQPVVFVPAEASEVS